MSQPWLPTPGLPYYDLPMKLQTKTAAAAVRAKSDRYFHRMPHADGKPRTIKDAEFIEIFKNACHTARAAETKRFNAGTVLNDELLTPMKAGSSSSNATSTVAALDRKRPPVKRKAKPEAALSSAAAAVAAHQIKRVAVLPAIVAQASHSNNDWASAAAAAAMAATVTAVVTAHADTRKHEVCISPSLSSLFCGSNSSAVVVTPPAAQSACQSSSPSSSQTQHDEHKEQEEQATACTPVITAVDAAATPVKQQSDKHVSYKAAQVCLCLLLESVCSSCRLMISNSKH